MTGTDQRCPACGELLPEKGKFCPECAAPRPGTQRGEISPGRDAAAQPQAEHRVRLQRAVSDHYELGRLVGRGGFAEVYAARDPRLKREVAVKTLRYDLHASSILLERFQREAEAMAQLRHPNIVPIYSVGEGDGMAYFVMPLVQGETLGQYIQREAPLPIAEVNRILFEAASALHHAHQSGMVHRDVKPDNILLEGEERRVQVTDLGIARAANPAEGSSLTGTGLILGTPDYMSPEQATEGSDVDRRTDLYSLGVVAYQMITGRLPFKASTLQGMIVKLITEEAPPATQYRPDCPQHLADIVARCLSKEPQDRYATAAEICAALKPEAPESVAVSKPLGLGTALKGGPAAGTALGRFRQVLLAFVIGNAAVLAVDLGMNGAVDFAPVIAAIALIPLASLYARLWTAGYAWQDVFRKSVRFPGGPISLGGSSTTAITGAFGTHASAVHRVRSERAVIAGLVSNMPRSERERMPEIVGSADQVVARTRLIARQLTRLDRLLEESGEHVSTDTQPSGRHRDEIEVRRDSLTGELKVAEAVIEELRTAVERAAAMGVSQSRTDLEVALEKADDVARSRT